MHKMSTDKNMDATVQFMMSALLFELYKTYIFRRTVEGVTICVVLALVVLWLPSGAPNMGPLYIFALHF